MIKELFKLIDKIEKQRQFDVCRTTETAFREMIDPLFEDYKGRRTSECAKRICASIEDLAYVGRIALAREYLEEFKKAIDYNPPNQN